MSRLRFMRKHINFIMTLLTKPQKQKRSKNKKLAAE
jgi:hypothetical protein